MAITNEQITAILEGEGETSAKSQSIFDLLQADINAIKVNREEIKEEKKAEVAKRHAIEEQFASLQEKAKKLEEDLKASSPENVSKVYDQRLQEQANVYEQKIAELNQVSDGYKSRISELEVVQKKLECMEEFNKAIKDKNIASDSVGFFADLVLGENCNKFDHRPIGDGKTILATKEGLSIESAVKAALETTVGKRFVNVASTGGNAEGVGQTVGNIANNPFKTGNLTEQIKLSIENPVLYNQLKNQA